VAITRPVGTGIALSRRVRALGGIAFALPGSRLRASENPQTTRTVLHEALHCDFVIFTSPAAVRFAAKLSPLRTRGRVFAPGAGTAAALKRRGLNDTQIPVRADSEGMLALPELQQVRGLTVGIVGAPGGRGLLQKELAARGACVTVAHIYERVAARFDRRHFEPLLRSRSALYVPLSSVEALRHLLKALPPAPRRKLLAGTAIASSARLQRAAKDAGFARVLRAASALDDDLIAAIVAAHGRAEAAVCSGALSG